MLFAPQIIPDRIYTDDVLQRVVHPHDKTADGHTLNNITPVRRLAGYFQLANVVSKRLDDLDLPRQSEQSHPNDK